MPPLGILGKNLQSALPSGRISSHQVVVPGPLGLLALAPHLATCQDGPWPAVEPGQRRRRRRATI